jgi:hypothetical protein
MGSLYVLIKSHGARPTDALLYVLHRLQTAFNTEALLSRGG